MQAFEGHGLGCWLGANDPESRRYTYTQPVLRTATYHTVLHTANAPVLDQDGIGGCVGFTDADILNTGAFYESRRRRTRRYLTDKDGYLFYDKATDLDEWTDENWPPDDTGTSVLAGAKALKALSYIDRYEWAWDFNGFLAALQRQPVMLGTLWTDEMSYPDERGRISVTGELVGGHAYMAFGLNMRDELIRCRNHWTRSWGRYGDFYVTFADMEWLIEQQGEVLVPVPA